MSKSEKKGFSLAAVQSKTSGLVEKDRTAAERALQRHEDLLPLEKILPRRDDTRPLNEEHVWHLVESISVLGLIQPPAVDVKGRLLAGGHRREALARLQVKDPDKFKERFGAGVRVMRFDFDADDRPDLAFAVEVAENEQRRDYTKEEVNALAERLKKAGYKDTVGAPKKGEKALGPALSVVVGKSLRHVRRLLSDKPRTEKDKTPAAPSPAEREVRRQLENHFGTKVELKHRGSKGFEIVVQCTDVDQLNALLQRIGVA